MTLTKIELPSADRKQIEANMAKHGVIVGEDLEGKTAKNEWSLHFANSLLYHPDEYADVLRERVRNLDHVQMVKLQSTLEKNGSCTVNTALLEGVLSAITNKR